MFSTPFQLDIHFFDQSETLWQQEYMILYMLRGSITLTDSNGSYTLNPEDIVAFAPMHIYTVTSTEQAAAAIMLTKADFLYAAMPELPRYDIEMYSCNLPEEEQKCLLPLRRRMANLFQLYYQQRTTSSLELSGQMLTLYDTLFRLFGRENKGQSESPPQLLQLQTLLEYAQEHFRDRISLESAADTLHISVSWLTRYFTAHMGVSFMQYVLQLRVQAAANALRTTGSSITDIAYDLGFSSPSALISRFRQQYNCTPKNYRRRFQTTAAALPTYMDQTMQADDRLIRPLIKYADAMVHQKIERPMVQKVERYSLMVDTAQRTPIKNSWRRLLNVGWAKDILSAEVQTQLRQIQTQIGFQYLRFHGIFDDRLLFCKRDSTGNLVYNFVYIDLILDFMRSVNLTPYLELGFIPQALAQNCAPQYASQAYVCMPSSMEEWKTIVRVFLLHCVERYGIYAVRQWRFTPMSCIYACHHFFTMEQYAEFFQASFEAIKEIDGQIPVGGPGMDISIAVSEEGAAFDDFMQYCSLNHCRPDFITCQCFPYDMTQKKQDFWEIFYEQTKIPLPISEDRDFMEHYLDRYAVVLAEHGYSLEDLAIEAWGATFLQCDLCNDTCYNSTYLVRNIVNNYDRTWCMGYWMLSDYTEDVLSPSAEIFHGGFGLFTYNGLTKSNYQGLWLLSQLSGGMVGRGDGWLAAVDKHTICIIASNYGEYHELYRNSYISDLERRDPYMACVAIPPRGLTFELDGLQNGMYSIETRFLNREHGSVFDAWVRAGRNIPLTINQFTYLQHLSEPGYHISKQKVNDHTLDISCILQPQECRVLHISYVDVE